MTALWSPSRIGGSKREPFLAFICDEMSADALRRACAELQWPEDKIHTGGLRAAIQSLAVSASPAILFVDLSESPDPLRDISALAEVCEPGTIVLSGGQVNDVRLYRDLIASGLQDYLLKPFNRDQLRDALSHAQMMIAGARGPDGTSEAKHLAVTVIGARGGCGASTVAANLASVMARQERLSTALLDLDVHFGTAALALDLEPGRGLTDAILNPARIDGLFLERALVAAHDRLSVLSAEAPISQPILSDGTGFRLLQDEVSAAFECTVRDTPRDLLLYNPELLADTPELLIISELTLACTRDVFRLLNWLQTAAPQVNARVVLNKFGSGPTAELSQREFEDAIEANVSASLPEDSKAVRRAAKLGKPLTELGSGSRLNEAIEALASTLRTKETIATTRAPATPRSAALGSVFARLGNLLPGKARTA